MSSNCSLNSTKKKKKTKKRVTLMKIFAKPPRDVLASKESPLPPGWHTVPLSQINDFITCKLCNGYLIDATTIAECLHSFCRACLISHLNTYRSCPRCNEAISAARPLDDIRSDPTLQDIVYKLVPKLFHNEMLHRKKYYSKKIHLEAAKNLTTEERGDVIFGSPVYGPHDTVYIRLVHKPHWNGMYEEDFIKRHDITNSNNGGTSNAKDNQQLQKSGIHASSTDTDTVNGNDQRKPATEVPCIHIMCPGSVIILDLKKFIALKFQLQSCHNIDIIYKNDILDNNCPLIDLVYVNSWLQVVPLFLIYKVTKSVKEETNNPSPEPIIR